MHQGRSRTERPTGIGHPYLRYRKGKKLLDQRRGRAAAGCLPHISVAIDLETPDSGEQGADTRLVAVVSNVGSRGGPVTPQFSVDAARDGG